MIFFSKKSYPTPLLVPDEDPNVVSEYDDPSFPKTIAELLEAEANGTLKRMPEPLCRICKGLHDTRKCLTLRVEADEEDSPD